MDEKIQTYIRTSEFYMKESEGLLAKLELCKNLKQAEPIVKKLESLKQKISYEIYCIDKVLSQEL
jgi:hypothetical protein